MNSPTDRPPRPEFSRPMAVERNAPAPRAFAIEANAAERAALARRFGLLSLDALRAEGTLESIDQGQGAVLTARFSAILAQPCVVSLEPVPAIIEDSFVLQYAAAGGAAVEPKEIEIDVEAPDPPEPLIDGQIDVGEAVAEHLALALDPYPRAPGARFEPSSQSGEGEDSPFKALSGLVKKDSL
jgi:uncharacterized metal-binding protein YceD (DUF177 family)